MDIAAAAITFFVEELRPKRRDRAELALRVDFAERLLARERETPRLREGGR